MNPEKLVIEKNNLQCPKSSAETIFGHENGDKLI
jgi:hypothetical protein